MHLRLLRRITKRFCSANAAFLRLLKAEWSALDDSIKKERTQNFAEFMKHWTSECKREMSDLQSSPLTSKRPRAGKCSEEDEEEDSELNTRSDQKHRLSRGQSSANLLRPSKHPQRAMSRKSIDEDDDDQDLFGPRYKPLNPRESKNHEDPTPSKPLISWIAKLTTELWSFLPEEKDVQVFSDVLRAEGMEATVLARVTTVMGL